MSAPKITFESLRAALERGARDGDGVTGAARKLGVSRAAVAKAMKRWPTAADGLDLPASGVSRRKRRAPLDPAAVEQAGGVDAAAAELGVSRRTVFRRLRRAKELEAAVASSRGPGEPRPPASTRGA